MKTNIVLLFGGVSCEHDISIITAFQTKMNIDEELYDVKCVYICKDRVWKLIENFESIDNIYDVANKSKEVVIIPSSNKLFIKIHNSFKELCDIDCIVNCMHGVRGEDGCMSGLCNLNNIPYTSSDMFGSIVGLDKCAFKSYMQNAGIAVINGIGLTQNEYFSDVQKITHKIEKEIGFPCIIKPARLGSSIGIKVCKTLHDLPTFLENALKFDKKVLVEKYLSNIKEFNIAIYDSLDGKRVSSIESPKSSEEILSFNNKYLKGKSGGEYLVSKAKSEKIPKKIKENIIDVSQKCYDLLQLKGVVRFDFILNNDDGVVYLNEINTIPGSLANYLFSNLDLDFQEQLTEQINFAIHENFLDSKLISHFESSVLENIDFNALKKLNK